MFKLKCKGLKAVLDKIIWYTHNDLFDDPNLFPEPLHFCLVDSKRANCGWPT
jgi:hypothetical protein